MPYSGSLRKVCRAHLSSAVFLAPCRASPDRQVPWRGGFVAWPSWHHITSRHPHIAGTPRSGDGWPCRALQSPPRPNGHGPYFSFGALSEAEQPWGWARRWQTWSEPGREWCRLLLRNLERPKRKEKRGETKKNLRKASKKQEKPRKIYINHLNATYMQPKRTFKAFWVKEIHVKKCYSELLYPKKMFLRASLF